MLSFRIMARTAVGGCQNCLVSWVLGVLCQSGIVASTIFFSSTGRRGAEIRFDVHETFFLKWHGKHEGVLTDEMKTPRVKTANHVLNNIMENTAWNLVAIDPCFTLDAENI